MRYRMGLALVLLLAAAGSARAGTITNGVWTPTGCGQEPTVPTIDLSSESAFSKTLNASDAYDAADGKYVDCVVKEANTDSAPIVNAAQAARDRRKAALAKLQADTDAGMAKYASASKKK